MELKICPLLGAGCHEMGIACFGEKCAWYIRGGCAMAVLAEATSSVVDHLEEDAFDDLLESCRH